MRASGAGYLHIVSILPWNTKRSRRKVRRITLCLLSKSNTSYSSLTLHNTICVRLLTEFACVKFENLDLTKGISLREFFRIKSIRGAEIIRLFPFRRERRNPRQR